MSGPTQLIDGAQRRRATTDFSSNFVVRAGAGTGKTSLLVERVLNALGSGQTTLTHVAAITFTEKAAGEMRLRIAEGLERLRALARGEIEPTPGGPSAADRAWSWLRDERGIASVEIARRALEGLREVDRATVTTIHGFCGELLREYPVEAAVDPDFMVDDGEVAQILAAAAWEEFTADELGPDAKRPEMWKRLLDRLALSSISKAARSMSDFLIPGALLDSSRASPTVGRLFADQARELAREIAAAMELQSGMPGTGSEYFTRAQPALACLAEQGLQAFQQLLSADAFLDERIHGKRISTFGARLTGITTDHAKQLYDSSRQLMRSLARIDDQLDRLLIEAVEPYAMKLRERFLAAGYVSFNGLLELTRNLLRDHPQVRRRLKEHCHMLLVDELQDTDPLQYEIVLMLAEETEDEAKDPFEVRLAPGRLFAVGDAKQSIYRFRGADYMAYRDATTLMVGEEGAELELRANFRSVDGIIDPINRLFADPRGIWKPSPHQAEYGPIEATRRCENREPRVEIWTVSAGRRIRADQRRLEEGSLIAQEIDNLVAADRCRYNQITILFRAFASITQYLRPLRRHGIPFVVDGGREFLRRPEVGQLMATLRTLSQPADGPALLAFLRSPAGAVSDTELHRFAAGDGRWDWRVDVRADEFPRVAACYAMLRELDAQTRHLPADRVIRRVVERGYLLPLGAAAFEGAQRVANLRKLATAAGELARDGRLSLEQVVDALEQGRLQDIETDRPLTDDAANAVRLTSIHRLKGLENDWIFVPDLAREPPDFPSPTDMVRAVRVPGNETALALSAGGAPNAVAAWYAHENRQHEAAEETRVLYVALTRARERLVLIGAPGRTRKLPPWLGALSTWGYDPTQPPADGALLLDGQVRHRIPVLGQQQAAVGRDLIEGIGRAVEKYTSAVQRLRQQARPALTAPSGLHEQPESKAVAPRGTGSKDEARAVGVAVHRLLEGWVDGKPASLKRRIAPLCKEVETALGLAAGKIVGEVRQIVVAFLGSPLATTLERAEVLGRELTLLLDGGQGAGFRGSIDLLYRESTSGAIVVADYKTDREVDETTLRNRYREQVDVYTDAVQQALELAERPRAELWLLRSGRRVVV